MAKKKKNRKVPQVLWRVFHKRVNTLAETIISLIPYPPQDPSKCRCKGRGCLGCIQRHNLMSFILRPKDSQDYRTLLTNCFVVVDENAPKLNVFHHGSYWNQVQIVRRTIEIIMQKCPDNLSPNLICTGFDKRTGNSAIVELLTSSAWETLLKRVGDYLMVYLLENTLIFLPLAQKQHRQVSGSSIKSTCFALLNRGSSNDQNCSSGYERKRKKASEVASKSTEQQASCHLESSLLLCSSTCIGCIQKQHIARFDSQRSKEVSQSPSENNVATTAAENACNEKYIPYMNQHNSDGNDALPKKCSRQWRWQRQRSLNSRKFSLGPCREGVLDKFQVW